MLPISDSGQAISKFQKYSSPAAARRRMSVRLGETKGTIAAASFLTTPGSRENGSQRR